MRDGARAETPTGWRTRPAQGHGPVTAPPGLGQPPAHALGCPSLPRHLRRAAVLALTLTIGLGTPAPATGQQPSPEQATGEELKWRVEQLRTAGRLSVGGATIRASDALLGAFEQRGFASLWSDRAALGDLIRALEASRADGLDPAHYHLAALATLARSTTSPAQAAERDLLATDALHRLARDLRFGRTEPSGPTTGRGVASPFGGADPSADLIRAAQSGRPGAALLALRPSHFVYQGLVRRLAELRQVQEAGGWAPLPPGRAMRRDSADLRVPLLRQRLVLAGDLPAEPVGRDARFDAALEAAVQSFQHRHGLNEDGVVGPATLAELNVPVERRIDQVRVNLERARWVTHDLPDTFVAVNVAGAKAYLWRAGDVVFESRAIVGREYTRTPVFSEMMRYIDLNPTWTVPPGIVGEVLARLRREPDYLSNQGIRVLDRSGRTVDPVGIDFSRYTAGTFPYVFRQDPGPLNALGEIKFMFPNAYNVYLHDTPARGLFAQEQRLFSHGCIRLQDPLRLAELLLEDTGRWSREALERAIATGRTQTIPLARPLPVLVLYWTASADLHGELHFYRDVYQRDAAVLVALDRP